jgi:AcrR family transcriptional regulator
MAPSQDSPAGGEAALERVALKRVALKRVATPRPRGQARGRATRARLLDAAQDLFCRHGYEGTSIGDVADAAGTGVGTVYHHFSDKRALLLELIERWAKRLEADQRTDAQLESFLGEDPRSALRGWLRHSYERLREQPSIYLVALAAANRDVELAEAYRRVEVLGVERLRRLLSFGQSRGFMRAELVPESAAFLIHETIDATATRVFIRDPLGLDGDRVVDELAEMICRYILVEPERPSTD